MLRGWVVSLPSAGWFFAAVPAEAIIGGELDGDRHLFGACILSRLADGTFTDCSSGALASSNVVIMAGHSAVGRNALRGAKHFVTFDPDVDKASSELIPTILAPHPAFDPDSNFNDIGVALLARPVTDIDPNTATDRGPARSPSVQAGRVRVVHGRRVRVRRSVCAVRVLPRVTRRFASIRFGGVCRRSNG